MKNLNFFIGGETETIVVYETIQTTYLGSPASSECISKLAGIKSQPWAMNVNGTPRLTIFFPILKLRTKVYIFIMRMKKNCLKNGICLESLFFFHLHDLITYQRPYLPIPSHWRLGFKIWIWWWQGGRGHKHSVYSRNGLQTWCFRINWCYFVLMKVWSPIPDLLNQNHWE